MTCCAHSTLWFIPSLSDNVHFPVRREFDLVVNLGLQGRWYFSPVSVVCREEQHRHAGTGFTYSVIVLDWWIWTLKTHIHAVICHQLLKSGFGSVGLWRKEDLTTAKNKTTMDTHKYTSTQTYSDFCNYDRLFNWCTPALIVHISQPGKGAGREVLSTLTCAALCEGLSVTYCCPHQSSMLFVWVYPVCCRWIWTH